MFLLFVFAVIIILIVIIVFIRVIRIYIIFFRLHLLVFIVFVRDTVLEDNFLFFVLMGWTIIRHHLMLLNWHVDILNKDVLLFI
jgi:hypothetical protein